MILEQDSKTFRSAFLRRLVRSKYEYWSNYLNKELDPLIRSILRTNVNLHGTGDTLLDFVAYASTIKFETDQCLSDWLELLSQEGIDVRDYLSQEVAIRASGEVPSTMFSQTMRQRPYILHFTMEDPVSVQVEWWIDPKTPGAFVLEEFKNFPLETAGYIWSTADESEDSWDVHWPFSHKYCYCSPGCLFISGGYPTTEHRRAQEHIKVQRYERREAKKRRRYYRSQGFRDRMPGAWPQ